MSLLFIVASISFACVQWDDGNRVAVEGEMVKRTLDLDQFSGFGLSLSAKIYLRQGSRQSVEIEARESVIENINQDVSDDYWKIKFKKSMRKYDRVTIWITLPRVDRLSVSGSGDILGENRFDNLEDLKLNVSGSGNIRLEAEADETNCVVTGSGNIALAGTANNQKVSITGSGDVESEDFAAETCVVRITGSGDCEVNVRDRLEVYITGSGDVSYKGDPSVKSRITGSGDVKEKY
ncbi:MAG: head GIN domain-containing protein [Bacteroidota bacterium]